MIIKGDGFEIEVWHDIRERSGDLEFYVYHEGKRYWGWAWTLEAIDQVMKKNRLTGECAGGSYFWVDGLIVMNEISEEELGKAVDDLVKSDDRCLSEIFSLVEGGSEEEE
jgi:hypothetical protein